MQDINIKTNINEYKINIDIVDHGENLHEYEPFWKWSLLIRDNNNHIVFDKTGPERGYFTSKGEAIKETIDNIANLQFLHLTKKDALELFDIN